MNEFKALDRFILKKYIIHITSIAIYAEIRGKWKFLILKKQCFMLNLDRIKSMKILYLLARFKLEFRSHKNID